MPDSDSKSDQEARPPVFVSGGKRLNFDRHEPYGRGLTDTFMGEGKCEGTYPTCSWEELCTLAQLVVDHPAFRLPKSPDPRYPPQIDDEETR